ncbi:hypothetical protein C8F01DRAFT_1265691 [Mycena amicta]|nr:hypothetical protein C8F01DRAFT_1265691 [Mycena amicta]
MPVRVVLPPRGLKSTERYATGYMAFTLIRPPGPPASRSAAEQPQAALSMNLLYSPLPEYTLDPPRVRFPGDYPPDPTTSILLRRRTYPTAMRIKTASIHSGADDARRVGPVAFGLWLARNLHLSSALHLHCRVDPLTTAVSSPVVSPCVVAGPRFPSPFSAEHILARAHPSAPTENLSALRRLEHPCLVLRRWVDAYVAMQCCKYTRRTDRRLSNPYLDDPPTLLNVRETISPTLNPGPPPIRSVSSHSVAVHIANTPHDLAPSPFTLVAPTMQESHELWLGLLEDRSLQHLSKWMGPGGIEVVSPAILASFVVGRWRSGRIFCRFRSIGQVTMHLRPHPLFSPCHRADTIAALVGSYLASTLRFIRLLPYPVSTLVMHTDAVVRILRRVDASPPPASSLPLRLVVSAHPERWVHALAGAFTFRRVSPPSSPTTSRSPRCSPSPPKYSSPSPSSDAPSAWICAATLHDLFHELLEQMQKKTRCFSPGGWMDGWMDDEVVFVVLPAAARPWSHYGHLRCTQHHICTSLPPL